MKKVELNLIDKAVAFFNPGKAVERLASRAKLTQFEYDATLYNRQRRVPSQLTGAEGFRSNFDRVEMMKRARDLDQNVGLVRSLLLKFATHIASNISYQARTPDQNVNSDVEAYWNQWWDKCDLSGRHTGSILMQIAVMSFLRDGDFFFILTRDQESNLRLQGIEADRIGDPFRTYTSLNHIGGIHINQETGAPDGYDVYLRTFGNAYMFQATIPASQVFHLYDPMRIDQYRGITAFCTAINDATDIYEIQQMEKMAQKIASSQGGIIKRNNNNASDLATLTTDLNADNQTIKIESIEPGRITYLEPGEEMQFPDSPNRPGNGFQEFHKILLRNICMGVGIPYSFAVDPSAMSGPTARLEMQQASRTFKRHQKLLEDKVLRPVKNIVIADAVARGLIKNNLGTKSTKGVFNFGASVSIDLGRESQSAIAEFKTGLRTAADIYSERGLDFESSIQQRARETKMVSDLAEKYGIPAQAISDIMATAFGQAPAPQAQQQPSQSSDNQPPQDNGNNEGSEDIVPPIKPQDTESGESGGDGDVDVGEEREPTEATPAEQLPTGTTKEGKIEPKVPSILESKKKEIELDGNCGTGAGGFQTGNDCAKGENGNTNIKENPKFPMPGVQKISSNGLAVRMADLKIAEENLKNNKPSVTPDAPVDVTYNIDTKEYELLDGYHRYLKARGGTIEKASKSKPIEILSKVKLIKNSESKFGGTRDLTEKEIENYIQRKKNKNLEAIQELSQDELKMLIAGMMGGIELGKYDDIDFTPPQGVRDAAKRGLEVRQKAPPSQRGGTAVGIARARDLSSGKSISPETARRMKAFFDRHEVDKKGSTWDEQGKGWQAWQLWGGDAGYSWAKKLVKQMNARDEKKNLEEPNACPIATQDIKTNLANRETAVKEANYGPANPNEPNEDYWKAKADEFQGDVTTAKKMLCGNCAAFNQTSKLLGCIKKGIGEDANEVAIGGNLGYCEIFDFKCAAKRTCDAWIVGGPITDKKIDKTK